MRLVPTPTSDKTFFAFNAVVSTAALGFLFWLLVLHRPAAHMDESYRFLPALNATFNSLSAMLLFAGYKAIRANNRPLHQRLMVSAFAVSTLFLISYVFYHSVHGDTKFTGTGLWRPIYFSILISHILLSMAVVPLALTAFYLAFLKRWNAHKKVTRWLFPIWMYVSVTGVLIFILLR